MSEDLIKRSDAIGACAYETIECYEARKAIRALPSADRPQGEWIWDEQILGLVCSECKELGVERSNFCPNCGCRMKGADDEAD